MTTPTLPTTVPVSYTHLDVYKRQPRDRALRLAALYRDANRRVDAAGQSRSPQEREVVATYLRDVRAALHESFQAR